MPFFDNSSKNQVDRQHPVWCHPHENKFWLAKSEFLELVCPSSPNTRFVNNTWCFVRFGQVMCGADQVSATIVPATQMTEHAKKWHKVTQNYCVLQVFQRDSVLSTWIRGLTGQSIPKSSWQHPWCQQELPANHKVHHFWQISRAWPTRICKFSGLCMVLCTRCQTPCPTRQ